jgi:diguanylate cyclase (GGDEF)-like protein
MAGKRVMVQDLQSANGTFVNGAPVEARQLSDGDKIRIGDTTILKFSIHDQLDEQFQKQLYRAALHDDLTQAFNKKYLLDHLHKELRYALRHRTPLTLLMLDIDHFKRFNDSYGHLAGDAVLSQFGKLVAATLRAEDIFARYGGEEFAIVTRGIALESASVLAERVRRLVESTAFRAGNQMLHVTVSIGAADVRHDTMDDVTKLIAAADAALYQAKHAGRNRVALSR